MLFLFGDILDLLGYHLQLSRHVERRQDQLLEELHVDLKHSSIIIYHACGQ